MNSAKPTKLAHQPRCTPTPHLGRCAKFVVRGKFSITSKNNSLAVRFQTHTVLVQWQCCEWVQLPRWIIIIHMCLFPLTEVMNMEDWLETKCFLRFDRGRRCTASDLLIGKKWTFLLTSLSVNLGTLPGQFSQQRRTLHWGGKVQTLEKVFKALTL